MHHLVDLVLNFVEGMGYTGIFFMMVLESSFIPFPSEVAMIPAGYLASLGKMNLMFAFIAGTLGALVGASINYFLGWKLGGPIVRSLVSRYGKYIFLSLKHYEQSEKYFKKHGAITTLVGRFIPAVRQLISGPAGIFKMNYGVFIIYTTIGAGAWNAVLLGIGYVAGQNDELVHQLLSQSFIGILVLIVLLIGGYIFYKKHRS